MMMLNCRRKKLFKSLQQRVASLGFVLFFISLISLNLKAADPASSPAASASAKATADRSATTANPAPAASTSTDILSSTTTDLIKTVPVGKKSGDAKKAADAKKSGAGKEAAKIPIYFPADKNNLKVLPQRFEYSVMDVSQIKTGDILIDADKVDLRLFETPSGAYRMNFSWPASLLTNGEILLKDHTGKALYTTQIDKSKLKITAQTFLSQTDEILRNDVAEFESEDLSLEVSENLRFLPYMNFCVFRRDRETKMQLCSRDLYVPRKKVQGKLQSLMARQSNRLQAEVLIDNNPVGLQGIIFLNKKTDNIRLKVFAQSGAFVEIETRRKDVSFRDVVQSDDGKNLIFTARGAEPVDEKNIVRLPNNEWQVTLPQDRPILYLKGEGDFPMRQEFYINGTAPKKEMRVFFKEKPPERTYQKSLTLKGLKNKNTKLKSIEDNSTFATKNELDFDWIISDLKKGTESRRFLNLQGKNSAESSVLGLEIYRGFPGRAWLGGSYFPSHLGNSSELAMTVMGHVTYWFEEFLNIQKSPMTYMNWGVDVEYQSASSKTYKMQKQLVSLKYKKVPGLDWENSSWGVGFNLQNQSTGSTQGISQGLLMGPCLFYTGEPLAMFESWFEQSQFEFTYWLSGSQGSAKLQGPAFAVKDELYSFWNNNNYGVMRLEVESQQFKSATSSGTKSTSSSASSSGSATTLNVLFGIGSRF
jgi:hypothetical protein